MKDNESTPKPTETSPIDADAKSQTSRISLGSARQIKSALETKKATSRISDTPTYVEQITQTIHLRRPPTSPITVQPIDMPPASNKPGDADLMQAPTAVRPMTAETAKRQTSRIGLPESVAPKSPVDFKRSTGPILGIPTHAGPIPQTIRLKRPATSQLTRPPTSPIVSKQSEPAPMPHVETTLRSDHDITEAPTIVKHIAAPKTSTSRIVLDDLPAPTSAPAKQATSKIPPLTTAEPPAPKTIRLKRPSTVSDAEEAANAAAEGALRTIRKGETSKIDLPIEDSSLTPITQRKTIKIKRTDRTTPAPRASTPAAVAAPKPGARAEAPAPQESEMLALPLVTLAATLCIAALVYIMVAQTFGVHLLLPASMQLH